MHCSNCGVYTEEGARFCESCGQPADAIEGRVNSENQEVPGFSVPNLFRGRIGRKHWILGVLLLQVVIVAVAIVTGLAMTGQPEAISDVIYGIVMVPLYIAYTVLFLGLHARRLHDMGHSGFAVLLYLIPIVNIILFIFMAFTPGTEGVNKFGSPPGADRKFMNVLLGKVK